MKIQLRLFVWRNFCPDWSGGLAVALAKDETEARTMIEKERGYPVYDWGKLTIYPTSRKFAACVSGGS